MKIEMKTEHALSALKNAAGVARAIGITKQAVSQWGELVPEQSALKLLRVNPQIPHQVLHNQQKTPEAS